MEKHNVDWKAVATEMYAALNQCTEQIQQMRGMFDDSDGAIESALEDADTATELFESVKKVEKDNQTNRVRT